MTYLAELTVADWDLTIERALSGPHTAEKLVLTRDRLTAAIRHSRLRGDRRRIDELGRLLDRVHDLLDAA